MFQSVQRLSSLCGGNGIIQVMCMDSGRPSGFSEVRVSSRTHPPRKIQVLEERHVLSILIYLSQNDGCRKSDLYRDISRNPRMPDKLDILERSGLIEQIPIGDHNSVRIMLTDVGRNVADALADVERMLS